MEKNRVSLNQFFIGFQADDDAGQDDDNIDEEEMKITTVNANSIIVERAQDNTLAASHVKGSALRVINPITSSTDTTVTYDDNAYIEDGDNFGFDGEIS